MNRKQRREYAKSINTPAKLDQLTKRFDTELRREYKEQLKKQTEKRLGFFITALVYTLHFSEGLRFGNKRIRNFMDDLIATVDRFETGEYSPVDYEKQLNDDGIHYFMDGEK